MEASELKEILDQHRLWIKLNGVQGKFANLQDADLKDADLRRADLEGAYLRGANLNRADLRGANLSGADFWCANLSDASLTGANLTYANLGYANLTKANLTGANLTGADLRFACLSHAILPNISWIIPGCLVQMNHVKCDFYLYKEGKWENFIQDTFGFFIQNNREEKTFDMLAGDRIIRNVPHWVKYSGLKQIASESV